jgi:hypothetical protein|tara:strand:- start:118 stop:252 length:135 start_codon:yes stop_codon:yes gene_type:complete
VKFLLQRHAEKKKLENISLSLELNDTMPKLGLILLIKEMKAKRG